MHTRSAFVPFIAALLLTGCIGTDNGSDLPETATESGEDSGTHEDNGKESTSEEDSDDATTPSEPTESGEPLSVNDERRQAAHSEYVALDRTELEQGFSPEELYGIFNEFALTHFGMANQPLIERYTGESLAFLEAGEWQHHSLNSAAMAFETTQPVRGYIAYGRDEEDLDNKTPESDRYYFNQLHHLTGLEPDTTYHYQFVARRADGEILRSEVRQFSTRPSEGLTLLEGGTIEQPLVLDEPGATYVLTDDVVAPGTAMRVDAPGITLDLNGHQVVYANAPQQNISQGGADTAATGIWSNQTGLADVRILNGQLEEGHVGNQADTSQGGLNAVYFNRPRNLEVAGLSSSYHGAQVYAMAFRNPQESLHVHHNDLVDQGFQILDRHGSGGGRPIHISGGNNSQAGNDFELNHNRVRRTRHMGLQQASLMRNNEIYVDSWATNSFAIQPLSSPDTVAGEALENRLFLTGYNAIGFGWGHEDLMVADNLVQMEGIATGDRRYSESWGELDTTSAMRITNFGSGGQVRNNLQYRNNVILGRARDESVMRGTMFYTDATIRDTVFEGNYVHINAEDEQTVEATPIVGQGVTSTQENHRPIYYLNNELVSNVANVRFGDSYGRGNRHVIADAVLKREGDNDNYHSIVFGGSWESEDHQLIDPQLKGGARYDDVWWQQTSTLSFFDVLWTVTLQGEAGASVTINDVHGNQVFSGSLGSDGVKRVPLKATTVRPAEWEEGASRSGVRQEFESQTISHTPHRISVGGQTREVELDAPETLDF